MTTESLCRLAPVFDRGCLTAGNSSGVNDGTAALLLVSQAAVDRYGLTPLARVVGAATAGLAPRIMGIGPIEATRRLLSRTGVALGDVDFVELNEAFATQVLLVQRALGLLDDAEHVNPKGGALHSATRWG